MKYIISCLFAVFNIFCTFSQIRGQILNEQNKPIPYANVLVQNSYIGTSANENGFYELPIKVEGTYTLIYKSIGFENFQKQVQITNFPITVNVVLKEETNALEEMVITATKEDPAYYIIRNVLANKKKNQDKIQSYSVDFYSKGSFIVDSLPDKILFVDLKEEKKELDSIKTNYVYLSETFSELKYQKPNKYSENVWASKVSGNDNGFSLNTGLQSNLDFYNNNIKQLDQAISPFANNTFTYYTFKLVTTFLDDHNQLINKIKVSPKSNVTPTFSGYVYIVENSWEIYAIDLTILGKSVKKPFIESFAIQQNFEYNSNLQIWTKQSQAVTIKMGLFGAKLRGNFLYVFTNYNINPTFNLNDFSKTIVKFSDDSNKKDSIFWNTNRPIALTDTEKNDYKIKDSLQIVSKNKEDSLRLKNNTFKIRKLITGYTYQSPKKIDTFRYNGLLNQYGFNTVQGYFLGTQLSYVKKDTVAQKNIHLTAHVNYGFSEQRWRASGDFTKVIHAKTNTAYTISGGSAIVQYNNENPISNLVNSVASLAFNKNFAKFYNKDFVAIGFKTDLYDGIQVQSKLEYANRSALQNHSHVNIFNLNTEFTSNNPLIPNNDALAFTKNTLTKFTIGTQIRFGNKYIEKPNQKQVITNDKFPVLFLKYENAFTSNIKDYHFQNIKLNIKYTLNLNEYGKLNTNSTTFTFINQNKQLEFIDYQHFNGNQTYVYNNQLVNNQFFLLPYYSHSTQKAAVTSHIAYNDKGFIINKIPLLKQTQWNIIANFNLLSTSHRNTYIEYAVGFDNLGFGKFRIFKLQYTQSNAVDKGFVFGINTNIF
jgi:hypothetical protein